MFSLRPFKSRLTHKNIGYPIGVADVLVREMGLEPTRRSPHAPQTCLSTIPTLSQALEHYNLLNIFCQYLFVTGTQKIQIISRALTHSHSRHCIEVPLLLPTLKARYTKVPSYSPPGQAKRPHPHAPPVPAHR